MRLELGGEERKWGVVHSASVWMVNRQQLRFALAQKLARRYSIRRYSLPIRQSCPRHRLSVRCTITGHQHRFHRECMPPVNKMNRAIRLAFSKVSCNADTRSDDTARTRAKHNIDAQSDVVVITSCFTTGSVNAAC